MEMTGRRARAPRRPWRSAATFLALLLVAVSGVAQTPAAGPVPAVALPAAPIENREPLLQLGTGDEVSVQVYGQPDMSTTTYVSDDGTIPMPLAGAVNVRGLSPAEAARRVEVALKSGGFLVDPHVTITLAQARSQRVSVLGEVHTPGRYAIESTTTVFDLLAAAGGATENAADVVYLLRTDKDGNTTRSAVDLKGLVDPNKAMPEVHLHGGDSVFVPHAPQFYIFGEVQQPNMYRLEPGMRVVQAIARSGGVTQRGSRNRVEIKRRKADGSYVTLDAKLTDLVQADDVIRVKEALF
jgi:polysaccharide export outer membrane protein